MLSSVSRAPTRLGLSLSTLVFACGPKTAQVLEQGSATSTEGATAATATESSGQTETETETETGTETEAEAGCDNEARLACISAASSAHDECEELCGPMLDFSCEGEPCQWECRRAYSTSLLACFTAHCPDPSNQRDTWWIDDLECMQPCYAELAECQGEQDCVEPSCSFDALLCVDDCDHCAVLPPTPRVFEGSCELPLPAGLPPARIPYSRFHLPSSFIDWRLHTWDHDELASCELEPNMGGLWDEADPQLITLCPEVCAQFEADGVLLLEFPPPPCN